MGVLYVVEPLDAKNRKWLSDHGVALPRGRKRGRNPTPAEIRDVCNALDGFRVKYTASTKNKFWQAIVDGKGRNRTRATILNFDWSGGSEDRRFQITFDNGDPALNLEIIHALSAHCGPLVVWPSSGDVPIVLWPEADPAELVRAWE